MSYAKKPEPFGKNNGRKPDLVCIGAQKAGTSWLHVVLAEHPDVWVPPFKELHFFDSKFIEECKKWAPWHVRRGVKQARNEYLSRTSAPDSSYLEYLDNLTAPPILNGNWYKGVFSYAPPHATCLDVTPEYSCLPTEGVEFVRKFLKGAKFIYIIRHPVDRVLSQLKMNVGRRKELPSTKSEWMKIVNLPVMQTRGNYIEYIPRWQAAFGSSQLMIIPYGRLKHDPGKLLSEIEQFAGLAHFDRFKSQQRTVHGSYPVTLPKYVIDIVRDRTQPQVNFLAQHFGPEFLAQTV